MAWVYEGDLGSGVEKTSDNSFLITAAEDSPAGNVVAVFAVTDNIATSAGSSNTHTITDESLNTWTKREFTQASGAANDGTTLSISYSLLTTQIDTGDDIILTTTANTTAKCLGALHWSIDEAAISEAGADEDVGATDPSSTLSISGLSSAETLYIFGIGIERGASGSTIDADYTKVHGIETVGGAAATNQTLVDGYRIVTNTGDTCDCNLTTAADWSQILIALREVTPSGAQDPYPYLGGGYFPTEG